mmetsp:Transcript_1063/g.1497  ORF Transcript_1063/g.1497 Transcript_1063/m.1497 type:complete len:193 (+) Transcript_1063:168-746(+)|eukprot:CAMPEP_0167760104 /NCGR_PEP_ID=MMETSP0110_2-20121227/11399_1 /TAXON_ID=629695 /ORGANISM="Gymnochlora sp., Strain CCMP2014" /LENGTH=192 /DNA_ID=CAMNT_0007646575 /DNA_START=104 /DNA_END=682 /DNA_ORIENTATION=-
MADQLGKLFCCIRVYCPCLFNAPQGYGIPLVTFSDRKGKRVRISNYFVAGNGTALANVPLVQNRAYWEIKVVEAGKFCVGVCELTKTTLDSQLSDRKRSWVFSSKAMKTTIKKGDFLGLSYDLSDIRPVLKLYINGKLVRTMQCSKDAGDVYPAVSVSDGCVLEANFEGSVDKFQYGPPNTFPPIMFTRDIL